MENNITRKKIAYFIGCSNANTGVGGHYHSIVTTARMNSDLFDVEIFILGSKNCPTIQKSKLKYTQIPYKKNIFKAYLKCKKLICENNFDIIHSFDLRSDIFARLISNELKIPKINTKCGGPSPIRYYPFQHYLILFSNENLNYFRKIEKFNDCQILIIPNRVLTFMRDDQNRIKLLREISGDRKVMLRISRISKFYEHSLRQVISLHNKLISQNIPIFTFIIGKVEDVALLNSLNNSIVHNDSLKIITDEFYTTQASEVINIADIVVGTGRSFMEASSKSKVMLTPISNQKFPAIVNSKNFNAFFGSNFSERNVFNEFDKDKNIEEILDTLKDPGISKENRAFNRENFNSYFSIETKRDEYFSLYTEAIYKKENYFDLCVNLLSFFKNYNK